MEPAGKAGQMNGPPHFLRGAQGWGMGGPVGRCPLMLWFLLSSSLIFMVPVACGLFPQKWYQLFILTWFYQMSGPCSP